MFTSTSQPIEMSSCSALRKDKAIHVSKNRTGSDGFHSSKSLQRASNLSFNSLSQRNLNNSLLDESPDIRDNRSQVKCGLRYFLLLQEEAIKVFDDVRSRYRRQVSQLSSERIPKGHKTKIGSTETDVYKPSYAPHTVDNNKAIAKENKDTEDSMVICLFREMTLQKSESDALLDKPLTMEPVSINKETLYDGQLAHTMGSSPPSSPPNVCSSQLDRSLTLDSNR